MPIQWNQQTPIQAPQIIAQLAPSAPEDDGIAGLLSGLAGFAGGMAKAFAPAPSGGALGQGSVGMPVQAMSSPSSVIGPSQQPIQSLSGDQNSVWGQQQNPQGSPYVGMPVGPMSQAQGPRQGQGMLSMPQSLSGPQQFGEGAVGQSVKPFGGTAKMDHAGNSLQQYANKDVNLNLHPAFQEKLPMVLEDLRQQGYQPVIASGFRTEAEQLKKVQQGYSKTMHSNHRTGNAVDIVDSRYGWNTNKYNNEIKGFANAMETTLAKYGLESGTKWKSFGPYGDFAHVQYNPNASQQPQAGQGMNQQKFNPQMAGKSPQSNQPLAIPNVYQAAGNVYQGNPVMQQVAATQAILESGLNGKPSGLAVNNNNLFGIKGSGTAGSVNMRTKEQGRNGLYTTKASFAKNATLDDSFTQHQQLMQNPRYKNVLNAQTPQEAFQALKDAGYATDKDYVRKLQDTYDRYVAPLSQPPQGQSGIGPQTMNQPMQGQQLASNQSMSDTYRPNAQGQREDFIMPLVDPFYNTPEGSGYPMPQGTSGEQGGVQMAQSQQGMTDSQGNPINWGLLQQILQQRGLA